MSTKNCIEKLLGTYKCIFGSKPKQNITSLLKKGDHPELNMSDKLDADGIKNYQLLIGTLQWSVSLRRIDITTAVMMMTGFRVAPRKGHLKQVQCIVTYLVKMMHAAICFGLKSLTSPLFLTNNLTGPIPSMATLRKFFPTIYLLLWESLSPSCTMWMQTYTTI